MIQRMSYDQLMKQVLQTRFADFLRLFAPDIAAELDLEDYLRTDNVLAAALASIMGRRRRGAARARLYVACLQHLLTAEAKGEVDGATADLLADVVETYLPVGVEDRAALRVQLTREGGNDMAIEASQLTWRSRVSLEVAEEVTQTVTQAVTVRTKRDDIKELIRGRFGDVSPEMTTLIDGTDSVDDLNALFRRAITAQTEADLLHPSH